MNFVETLSPALDHRCFPQSVLQLQVFIPVLKSFFEFLFLYCMVTFPTNPSRKLGYASVTLPSFHFPRIWFESCISTTSPILHYLHAISGESTKMENNGLSTSSNKNSQSVEHADTGVAGFRRLLNRHFAMGNQLM